MITIALVHYYSSWQQLLQPSPSEHRHTALPVSCTGNSRSSAKASRGYSEDAYTEELTVSLLWRENHRLLPLEKHFSVKHASVFCWIGPKFLVCYSQQNRLREEQEQIITTTEKTRDQIWHKARSYALPWQWQRQLGRSTPEIFPGLQESIINI